MKQADLTRRGKQKTVRGWVVVDKRNVVMQFAFGPTRRSAQEVLTWVWGSTNKVDKWLEYAAKGYRVVRATMTVELEKAN